MTTPNDIRSRMLNRASRLISGVKNEEAWHLIGLFQQTHPNTFLQICHHTLASFLELTHDYFDQGWPLLTRLLISNQKSTEHRRRRSRSNTNHTNKNNNNNIHEVFESPIGNPLFISNNNDKFTCLSPVLSNLKTSNIDNQSKKFKTKTGSKRILKQLLPSMFPMPNSHNDNSVTKTPRLDHTSTKQSNRSHSKTKSFFRHVQPLFSRSASGESVQQLNYPFILRSNPSKIDYMHINSNSINDYSAYCTRYCNVDSTICATLIDYMISNPNLCLTEGLFRIPGNSLRIRDLWLKLHHHFQTPYLRIPQPEPDLIDENFSPYPVINHIEINELLQSYSPHDITSLILRCLTTCTEFQRIHQTINFDIYDVNNYDYSNDQYSYDDGEFQQTGGLIPLEAGNLLFLATELQYKLKNNHDNKLNEMKYDDWVYILCHSRQLLAYRIVLQLLLPIPERYLLMNLLRLFKIIDESNSISKMTAECLARCTAFAVFGAPLKVKTSSSSLYNKENIYNCESYTNSLTKRIDTLTNLIKMFHELEDLPLLIYNAVRNRLRSHLGNSPIPRTVSQNHNHTSLHTLTEQCCHGTLYDFENELSIFEKSSVNDTHPIQTECNNNNNIECNQHQNILASQSIKTIIPQTMNNKSLQQDLTCIKSINNSNICKTVPIKIQTIKSQNNLSKNYLQHKFITSYSTSNLEPFQLWKRYKTTGNHSEMKCTFLINSSSTLTTKHNKHTRNPNNNNNNNEEVVPCNKLLIKSRSSSTITNI
ncbi:unnamed protein product [Heterobilharzia americana]|nr:unnamed protein product [Heterobilharzia americana]